MEKKPVSREGFDALIKELKQLKEVERPEVMEVVQWARSLGDLSENADYSAAKEKQRFVDSRIAFLEGTISNATVIDVKSLSGEKAMFGAHIIAQDGDGNKMECQILSDIESDGKYIVSCFSPIGRALIGKCAGDYCTVRLPSGEKEYEILKVSFKG